MMKLKRHTAILTVDLWQGWIVWCGCGWRIQLSPGEIAMADRLIAEHLRPARIH